MSGAATSKNGNAITRNKNGGNANTRRNNNYYSIQKVESSDTQNIFNVIFYQDKIFTTVTHTESDVDRWINDVYNCFQNNDDGVVVGLDIEWVRLSESSQRNKVAILQLSFGETCLIFQFFYWQDKVRHESPIPKTLVDFLKDKRIIFAGVGIDKKARMIWVDHALYIARSQDLGILADIKLGREDLYKFDMKSLALEVFETVLPKPEGVALSSWDIGYWKTPGYLTNEQIKYACLDAYASFRLGEYLKNLPDPRKTPEEEFSCSQEDNKEPPQDKANNQDQGPDKHRTKKSKKLPKGQANQDQGDNKEDSSAENSKKLPEAQANQDQGAHKQDNNDVKKPPQGNANNQDQDTNKQDNSAKNQEDFMEPPQVKANKQGQGTKKQVHKGKNSKKRFQKKANQGQGTKETNQGLRPTSYSYLWWTTSITQVLRALASVLSSMKRGRPWC